MFLLDTPSHTPCHNRSRSCAKGSVSVIAVLAMALWRPWNGQNLVSPGLQPSADWVAVGSLPSLARPPLRCPATSRRAGKYRSDYADAPPICICPLALLGGRGFRPRFEKLALSAGKPSSQLSQFSLRLPLAGCTAHDWRLAAKLPNYANHCAASAADDRRPKDCADMMSVLWR